MARPLFIHSSADFLDRVSKESDHRALISNRLVQGLQWVTNPETELSAVFFSPDDSSFSAFKFIEVILKSRPVLPIFLIETETPLLSKLKENLHIRGFFKGHEPYQTYQAAFENPSSLPFRPQAKKQSPSTDAQSMPISHAGYIPVSILDFFSRNEFPFSTFIASEDQKNLRLFAERGSSVDLALLGQAAQQSRVLYVLEEEVRETQRRIQEERKKFIQEAKNPVGWRTSEVMADANQVMDKLKSEGVSSATVGDSQNLLKDLFQLLNSRNPEGETEELAPIIERARKCNRSMFCASYSMLICQALKFERKATVEMLGVASILQDVSLFQTPFGDLSEKAFEELPADAREFFLNHPVLSAKIVEEFSDTPEVTLQIIRQQHERKDKSGFPNRVGGSQLHPMAEILSLVNSFFDLQEAGLGGVELGKKLVEQVFPHYSESLVQTFKTVVSQTAAPKK